MTTDRLPDSPFDPRKRFIRLVERRADGMVEFEFAVGEPELFVEMLLPEPAFVAFCAAQGVAVPVSPLVPVAAEAVAPESLDEQARRDLQWTLHDAQARHGGPHPH
jgi:phenol hydroxylase P0 protein